jgi:hypothetical protein
VRKHVLAGLFCAAGLALFGTLNAGADGAANAAAVSPANTGAASWSTWTFDPILRLWGADLGVGYRGLSLIPGDQTTFWVYGGGGYEGQYYYRDSSGNLLSPGQIGSGGTPNPGQDPRFNRIEAAWRLGIEQGFAWNPRTSTNLFEAFLFYRGRYDLNQVPAGSLLAAATALADQGNSFLNILQAGLGYDDLLTDGHLVRGGTSAEVSAAWGPPWFFNSIQGASDFIRFNASFTWFVPVFDAAPQSKLNVFSVYLGEYFSADYAVGLNGTPVPLYIRQTFGGRIQDRGLGDQVRGVDKGAYDTNLKAVNNLELRANLLAIPAPDFMKWLAPYAIPGVLAYFDCGAYDQVGEPGISSPGAGLVASIGAGVFVEVPGWGTLLAYVEDRLDNANAAGDRLRLLVLEFGMQF